MRLHPPILLPHLEALSSMFVSAHSPATCLCFSLSAIFSEKPSWVMFFWVFDHWEVFQHVDYKASHLPDGCCEKKKRAHLSAFYDVDGWKHLLILKECVRTFVHVCVSTHTWWKTLLQLWVVISWNYVVAVLRVQAGHLYIFHLTCNVSLSSFNQMKLF